MIFLLPSDQMDLNRVCFDFKDEYNSITTLGYNVSLFNYHQFISTGEFVSNFDFKRRTQTVILRSKHLRSDEYQRIWNILNESGFNLINSPQEYESTHHYPIFSKYFGEYSPKSVFTSDFSDEVLLKMRKDMGGDLVIKDYSKIDIDFLDNSIVNKDRLDEDFLKMVHKFREGRSNSINVGIVLKEFLELKDYGGSINKWRIIFFNGKSISIENHSGLSWVKCPEISLFKKMSEDVPSNFFSIDIVELKSGNWMVLDGDDGSQSNLSPNLNELVFYMNFLEFDKKEKL